MKKITLLILLLFFSHAGFSQWSENFEAAPAAPVAGGVWTLPSGDWNIFDNGVGSQNWRLNTAAFPAFSAPNAAFINNQNIGQGTTSADYLATPLIPLPTNAQLRFQTRMTVAGNQGVIFEIRAAPAGSNPALAASYTTLIATFNEDDLSVPSNITSYIEKVVPLPASLGSSAHIAFVKIYTQPTVNLGGDRWLLDDIRVVQKCLEPTAVTATNIGLTSADLNWANPSNSTEWEIEIVPFGDAPTGNGVLINTKPFTATNITVNGAFGPALMPGTQYKYKVRSICAGNVTSDWSTTFAFVTTRPGLTCTSPIVIGSTPYSTTDNTASYEDNYDVAQPGNCGGAGTNYMAGNDVFYSYTPTVSGNITIKMTPTANATSIFVYEGCSNVGVSCVAGVANNTNTVRDIPSLAVTAGTTYIIVISSSSMTQTSAYTLVIQTLNCAPPSGLSATGTGPNSANLSWSAGVASSWEVFVQTAGSQVPTGAGTTTTVNTNYSVTTLTGGAGLVLGTPYQYWVRADCGNGTFSPWTGPYLFNTTSCTSGCNYSFIMTDSYGDGWNGNTMNVVQNGVTVAVLTGPTAAQGQAPATVSVPLCDGAFTLFWNAGGNYPTEVGVSIQNSFGQIIFTKPSGTGSVNSLLYTGNVNCSTPDCLPPTSLTAINPTTNGATLNWTPNGPLPVSWDIYAVPAAQGAPTPATAPTVTIPGTTTLPYIISGLLADTAYKYYVRAVCASGGSNPWSTASPTFTTLPTCPKPTNITLTSATENSLVLDWTAAAGQTQWQYIVLPAGSPIPTAATTGWVVTNTHPVTVSGLTAGTNYSAYIMAICSPTDSSTVAGPANANTSICPPANQCLYTFTMTDSYGDGWSGNTMAVIQNGVTVATIGSTFTTGAGPIIVQVPICHGIPFSLFWNTGGSFSGEVGVSITSFLGEVLYTKPAGTGVQGTTLYTGTGECIAPTCIKPTNVLVSNLTLNSAVVSWTDNNSPAATSWDIIVLPAAAPAPLPTATGFTNVSTNPYTLTNLTAGTLYKVYVRAVCSSTDSSFWSLGTQFSTTICAPSDVCDYTFSMWDAYGDGWNGNTMSVTQNGILVATLLGPPASNGTTPLNQVVTLCNNTPFALFWNSGGSFGTEVGISITNAVGAVIFTKSPGTGSANTQLFTGTVSCVPATCPKPVQLAANSITETSAILSWVESGTSTSWELLLVPFGSPAPTPTTVGIVVTNPYPATLTSGTAYQFYVRAICSATDKSNWAGPMAFNSLIANDDCANAVVVPVNADQSCAQTASGTVIGATASIEPNSCFGTADDDVWFEFTALGSTHTIDLTNIAGSTNDLFHVVYSGDICGSLTQLYCSDDNSSVASNLVVGQTYKIRVYTYTATPNQTSTFTVCIGTIAPPISTSTTLYTVTQLVEQVLLNSTCGAVSNITSSTGTNFGSVNGIGYFNQNGSGFPFEDGVILSTGSVANAPGPNNSLLADGNEAWGGDASLSAVLAQQGIGGTLGNASKLEFDFVPLTTNFSFEFLFASEEYGTFQCSYSDVFAFLLTDLTTGITTNLAVVPGTNTPISVTTIRNSLYNNTCSSVNVDLFGNYYEAPLGIPNQAPINFNGNTVPLFATATVIPGNQYHIKLAIADYGPSVQDNSFDSAVFIKGGSFDIGNIDLGVDLLVGNGNALCNDTTYTIDSNLPADIYTFIWSQDGVVIPGETGSTLTISQAGTYTLIASLGGTTCSGEDTIIIEFYDQISPAEPNDLYSCGTGDIATFDLTENSSVVIAPLTGNFTISYYETEADAIAETNAIQTPDVYVNISNPQTIFIRIENNLGGCFTTLQFDLIISENTPDFTIEGQLVICEGSTGTLMVVPTNFDLADASYIWTLDGNVLPVSTPTISFNQSGTYSVTVNNGCPITQSVVATITTVAPAVAPPSETVCNEYILPVLSAGNYYTQAGGQGTMLNAGDAITQNATLYVYSVNGDCTSEDSFTITINTAVADTPADVVECTSYTLPALTANNAYYTEAGGPTGAGVEVPVGTVYNTVGTTTTLYVYALNGTCFDENTFTVTISGAVTADVLEPVVACDEYMLQPLSANNFYFTGAGGTGTELPVETLITTPGINTIYIRAVAGDCTDESSFTVTINQTPIVPQMTTVNACDSYLLPTLSIGDYYTAPDGPNGTGTLVNPATVITQDTTLWIYAQTNTTPNCSAQSSFDIFITPTPTVTPVAAVEACQSYTLPAIVGNGAYFSQENGQGPMQVGDVLTSSQMVYVFAQEGTCSSQESFMVSIGAVPDFNITGICENDVYTLRANVLGESYDPLGVTYTWSSTNGTILGTTTSSFAAIDGPGMYTLTISTPGCPSVSKNLEVTATQCMIQKGISPNGDGMNDCFKLNSFNVDRLSIFNRYGMKVYERANYKDEWCGQSDKGDELPDGTYYYVIERASEAATTGWIYINRKN